MSRESERSGTGTGGKVWVHLLDGCRAAKQGVSENASEEDVNEDDCDTGNHSGPCTFLIVRFTSGCFSHLPAVSL